MTIAFIFAAINTLRIILDGTTRAAVAVALLLLTGILLSCAYNTLFHPLARVPGPWAASVSNIWLAWHAKNGRVAELAKTLHDCYGPAVRVGPNEIWFNSKEAFKAIYSSGSGFEKSEFYRKWTANGTVQSLTNTYDEQLLQHWFARSNLTVVCKCLGQTSLTCSLKGI
jgi:hypothetical protein